MAAGNNQTEAAKLLVRHGADLNKLDGVIAPPHTRRVMRDAVLSFDAQSLAEPPLPVHTPAGARDA